LINDVPGNFIKEAILLSDKFGHFSIEYLISKNNCTKELAEDIFSEAMLNFRDQVIYQKVTKLKNPKNYLLGICLNLFRNHLRSEKRFTDKKFQIKRQLYSSNPNYLEQIISIENDQEKKVIAIDSFEQLDEKCREILRLFYVEELKMKEIATIMQFANDKVAKNKKSVCYKKWREIAFKSKKKHHAE